VDADDSDRTATDPPTPPEPVKLRRRWLPRTELIQRLATKQADFGLREDLADLAGDTDDLGSNI
jgi:hypothetical protein